MSVYFRIIGKPQGKGRPRFTRGGKPYTPAKTVAYERNVVAAYQDQAGEHFGDRPLVMCIVVFYEVAKSTSKKRRQEIFDRHELPCKKPDADNVAKIICDALNGIAYKDDAQIVELHVRKCYTPTNARVEVFISEVVT